MKMIIPYRRSIFKNSLYCFWQFWDEGNAEHTVSRIVAFAVGKEAGLGINSKTQSLQSTAISFASTFHAYSRSWNEKTPYTSMVCIGKFAFALDSTWTFNIQSAFDTPPIMQFKLRRSLLAIFMQFWPFFSFSHLSLRKVHFPTLSRIVFQPDAGPQSQQFLPIYCEWDFSLWVWTQQTFWSGVPILFYQSPDGHWNV